MPPGDPARWTTRLTASYLAITAALIAILGDGVPGRGDAKVIPNMWFSIELQATTPVPEWGNQPVRSAQEEDAVVGADGLARWALKRQTEFHLVRPR